MPLSESHQVVGREGVGRPQVGDEGALPVPHQDSARACMYVVWSRGVGMCVCVRVCAYTIPPINQSINHSINPRTRGQLRVLLVVRHHAVRLHAALELRAKGVALPDAPEEARGLGRLLGFWVGGVGGGGGGNGWLGSMCIYLHINIGKGVGGGIW